VKLLSVSQAAEILGVKVGTVRLWVSKRRLAHVKLSRCVRIPEAEINRLICESTVPAREDRNARSN
jgi:excisionase family DNA binding protein